MSWGLIAIIVFTPGTLLGIGISICRPWNSEYLRFHCADSERGWEQ